MPDPTTIGALIGLGVLTKPAAVLLERISNAIGVLYRPRQIVREAKAEAAAALIKAEGEIEITDLQRRACQRLLHEEERKQENIEQVVRLALPDVSADAKPDEIATDWLTHFFDRSRLVSDSEMQTLWGRLLAGEANKPGTYSRRTIDLVAVLEPFEARLFTELCRFCWVLGGRVQDPVVFVLDLRSEIYRNVGLHFGALTHLDAIGLLRFEFTGFTKSDLPRHLEAFYYGHRVSIELPSNTLDVGQVLLTETGRQLIAVSGAEASQEIYDFVCAYFESRDCGLTKDTLSVSVNP